MSERFPFGNAFAPVAAGTASAASGAAAPAAVAAVGANIDALALDYAHEIPFHDCDPMGVVWHGNYVRYCELARCALLERVGYNYDHMAESGYAWPVIDLQLRYAQPCRFKQRIVVTARIVEWEHRLKITYLIRDAATGTRLTKGSSVQVAVAVASGEMQLASPRVLLERLGVAG